MIQFMWYFPAQNGNKDAPLTIWLQGGPGGSSLFGLFSEMGPYSLGGTKGHTLIERKESWNKEYGMLFIDNPVGAGFSYPDGKGSGPTGYCTNTKTCVADNLYGLITGFYTLFPEQLKVPLFITGESYGGHYVPAFAHKVYSQNVQYGQCFSNKDCSASSYCNLAHPNEPGMCHGSVVPTGKMLIPLRGIAVGDGWIDPINMIGGYPEMMFNFGLADSKQKKVIQDYCDRTVQLIQKNQMKEAFDVWDEMLNGDIYPYPNYFHNITGSNDYDNFLRTNAPEEFGYFGSYVMLPEIKAAMHTGNVPFASGHDCEINLLSDFHVSLASELIDLLETNYYRIFIYSGQLDVIIGAPLTERFLNVLPWSGLKEYQNVDRTIWMDNTQTDPVSGYVRSVKNMKQIIIRGAGHIAPYDQPGRALDMINHLITGKDF
jgi:vitellogenic carboxypeptidase-like protein